MTLRIKPYIHQHKDMPIQDMALCRLQHNMTLRYKTKDFVCDTRHAT